MHHLGGCMPTHHWNIQLVLSVFFLCVCGKNCFKMYFMNMIYLPASKVVFVLLSLSWHSSSFCRNHSWFGSSVVTITAHFWFSWWPCIWWSESNCSRHCVRSASFLSFSAASCLLQCSQMCSAPLQINFIKWLSVSHVSILTPQPCKIIDWVNIILGWSSHTYLSFLIQWTH